MPFKSVTIICFAIILYTDNLFDTAYSAAIAKFNGTKAADWPIYGVSNELYHDQQQQQQTQQNNARFQSILSEFIEKRNELISSEAKLSFGHDIKLNANELQANKIIMDAKEMELENGLDQPMHFNPSRHLFEVLSAMKQSTLFKLIQRMPKGNTAHLPCLLCHFPV